LGLDTWIAPRSVKKTTTAYDHIVWSRRRGCLA